jgi:hypothetical protein
MARKYVPPQKPYWRDYDLWVPQIAGMTAGILTLILLGLWRYINE